MPTNLNSAALMKFALRYKVGGMGKFGGFVAAKPSFFPVKMDARLVLPAPEADTKKSCGVVNRWVSLILHVGLKRGLTKIRPSVIVTNAIDMVDKFFWPFARHVQPCKAVGGYSHRWKNANNDITLDVQRSGNLSNRHLAVTKNRAPSKNSSFRLVMQPLAHQFRC